MAEKCGLLAPVANRAFIAADRWELGDSVLSMSECRGLVTARPPTCFISDPIIPVDRELEAMALGVCAFLCRGETKGEAK